ncbi:hypothetical protein CFC21_051697 [Triticum aestivum]|uniref:F-box domain-containing protein n=3 Tax=Triticum TaxID=4564 RepID=A0A9R0VVT4_TRITD|nr:uncharacterized protein LOC123081815 [Triticum aestivum]KAF7041992.1 hypothetical protein CFC21_051697 [Triticum aestivum]VAH89076.1 unnamed protein product [Triticum turgidum subsp. durum]
MDSTEALPDDALANILRRLPASDLAASCCVRKAWCAIVDAHRLLLPHFLPRAVRGLFVNYIDYDRPRFFTRPSTERPAINGDLGFLPGYNWDFEPIVDHCNGLLIYGSEWRAFCVVNPATRRWERLPRLDAKNYNTYLVFDPAVSPHYQVFAIPQVPEKVVPVQPQPVPDKKPPTPFCLTEFFSLFEDTPEVLTKDLEEDCEDGPSELSPEQTIEEDIPAPSPIEVPEDPLIEDPEDLVEFPPSSWMLDVFSSSTKEWQKRLFVREGEALDTVATIRLDRLEPTFYGPRWRYGVYRRGAFYVHCRGAFVARLSLKDGKYQLVKTPIDIEESKRAQPYLGKSEKGVYFATIHDEYLFRVWILNESCCQISWALKHHIDLNPWATIYLNQPKGIDKTWFLYGDNNEDGTNGDENFEWNSDDDNVLNIEDDYEPFYSHVSILGFHPYKEIVFLEVSSFRVVAYHLNSSKVQYLGRLRPKDYYQSFTNGIYESFLYTPCMIGELSERA